MRVAYIGNFGAEHSTENHVRQALEALGVEVVRHQENDVDWSTLAADTAADTFVLWTTTYDYAPPATFDAQRLFLEAAKVPTVGFHLDRWWGLNRQDRIGSPFFACDLVVTADGGHAARWLEAGVEHLWMPPAVSQFECKEGTARDEYRSPVAFVGSWQGGYHAEWRHRDELVRYLQRSIGTVAFWPQRGQPAVRGDALRDLYASSDVVVGDSCLAGSPARYWSDRVPETLGRGGFLIHPEVEGFAFADGVHLATWPAGDWDALGAAIVHYLDNPAERADIARAGRAEVLRWHTYTERMRDLIRVLEGRSLI